MNNRNSEQGSAIIWILLGVALFAALNFAFNSGSRTSTAALSDAEAESYATQIIGHWEEVKTAVKRLQLRGCNDTAISFENNATALYTNPNSPVNKSCHVFNIAGAGLQYREELSDINTFLFTGDVPFKNTGTTDPELAFQNRISKEVCYAINKKLGIEITNEDDILENIGPIPATFKGAYGIINVTNIAGDEVPEFLSKKKFCRKDGASNYFYVGVLIAR